MNSVKYLAGINSNTAMNKTSLHQVRICLFHWFRNLKVVIRMALKYILWDNSCFKF